MAVIHHGSVLSLTEFLAILGSVTGVSALSWNVYTWWWSNRFNVVVALETASPHGVLLEGPYEIAVTARNLGRTNEAVQEIHLLYPEHQPDDPERVLPSVRVLIADGALPPNRNVREVVDLRTRFSHFPVKLTAAVLLESGRYVKSPPFYPIRVELAEQHPQSTREDDVDPSG